MGHRVLLWRLSGLRELPEYTTKKRGGDDLFWRCFVKNDLEGIQPPFGRFWGARRTLSLYMSSFDDAKASMPTLHHKGYFAYESSAPPMARTDGSAWH